MTEIRKRTDLERDWCGAREHIKSDPAGNSKMGLCPACLYPVHPEDNDCYDPIRDEHWHRPCLEEYEATEAELAAHFAAIEEGWGADA